MYHFCPCKNQHYPILKFEKSLSEPVYNFIKLRRSTEVPKIQKLSLDIISESVELHLEKPSKLSGLKEVDQISAALAIDSSTSKLRDRFIQKIVLSLDFLGCDDEVSQITGSFPEKTAR